MRGAEAGRWCSYYISFSENNSMFLNNKRENILPPFSRNRVLITNYDIKRSLSYRSMQSHYKTRRRAAARRFVAPNRDPNEEKTVLELVYADRSEGRTEGTPSVASE